MWVILRSLTANLPVDDRLPNLRPFSLPRLNNTKNAPKLVIGVISDIFQRSESKLDGDLVSPKNAEPRHLGTLKDRRLHFVKNRRYVVGNGENQIESVLIAMWNFYISPKCDTNNLGILHTKLLLFSFLFHLILKGEVVNPQGPIIHSKDVVQPSTDIKQWRSSHKSQTFLIVHQHQSDQMTTLKHYFLAFESSPLFARCQNFWILFKLNTSTKILSSQTVDVLNSNQRFDNC